jgi:hypothetical protein
MTDAPMLLVILSVYQDIREITNYDLCRVVCCSLVVIYIVQFAVRKSVQFTVQRSVIHFPPLWGISWAECGGDGRYVCSVWCQEPSSWQDALVFVY